MVMTKKLLFTFMTFFISLAAFAQVTTSNISGHLKSTDGEEIIGATIQAVHTPTGSNYGTITNLDGNFNLQGLRSGGPYTVTISYVGYQTQRYENITLALGETYSLDVTMKESSIALGEVMVTASRTDVYNLNRMGAAENFDSKKISQTASVERSLYDVAKMNPLAVKTSGGMSIAGSNNKYNSFQIDGTVNNDVFGLSGSGTNGGQTGANPISMEAIDEVQVVIAPFDVRQSGFTGGGINAVTKSGTNKFHASAYTYYNNEDFYGKTPGKEGEDFTGEREKMGSQSSKTYGATFGGPIIKNKLFLFANYERVENTYPSSYNIGSSQSKLDKGEVDQIVDHLSTLTGGYNGGGYGPQDIDKKSDKLLARLDWNINDHNKLMIRYSYLNANDFKFSSSPYSASLNDNGYTMKNKTHNFVAELNTQLGNHMSNMARIGYTRVRDARDAKGQALPFISVSGLTNNTSLNMGMEQYSAANALNQDVYQIEDNFTWQVGNHNFTVGTHNEFFNMANLFIAYNYGSYEYDGLNSFLNDENPENYRYQYSREDIVGTDRWMPEWGAGQLAVYGQDEWRVSDALRLTYGLRVDMPVYFDSPMENDLFNNSRLASFYNVKTGQMPSNMLLFSPRAGFRLYMNDNHTTLLRGGAGIFTGRIPFVWMSNCFSNTGMGLAGTQISGADEFAEAIAKGFKPSFDPHSQWVDPTAAVPTAEVDVVSDDFKYPQVLRLNAALEQELPGGVKMTLEGMFSRTFNNILYRNLNYTWEEDSKLAIGTNDNRYQFQKVDDQFTNVILLENTNKGYSANMTAKFEKNFDSGLNLMAAYTWGKSTGVNDGTSSQAYSSWKYNYTYNGDADPIATNTAFDQRHRIIASVSYRKEYAKHFASEVSLFYQGYSGGHYSLVYYNDMNGDGRYGNDLLYIPTDAELAAMNFTEDEGRSEMSSWIHSDDYLEGRQGTYAQRNGMDKPFEHHFDLHFAQDFFINVAGQRNTLQLNFDIMNVGNLLNHEWGLYHGPSNGFSQSPVKYDGRSDTYQWRGPADMITVSDISSRWHAQVGVKYKF